MVSPRCRANASRRRAPAPPTPTALRPPAQGWPRHEAYPGFDPETETNRIAVVGDLTRFPNRPVLPMFFSSPLCGSWFNPSPLFNHEVHQRHETKPRNPVPRRGPRPGGATDGRPARERWVPSPHEDQPRRGDRTPSRATANIRLPLQSWNLPCLLRVFASSRAVPSNPAFASREAAKAAKSCRGGASKLSTPPREIHPPWAAAKHWTCAQAESHFACSPSRLGGFEAFQFSSPSAPARGAEHGLPEIEHQVRSTDRR